MFQGSKSFALLFLLTSVPLLATDAIWISTTDTNMATAANWSADQIPDGVATFDSSLPGVQTQLQWDPMNAMPVPIYMNQFAVGSFFFATPGSAKAFSFTFAGNGCPSALKFTGAGITGLKTNTLLTFDNTNSTSTMTYPQLLFAPKGNSALANANVNALNAIFMQGGPGTPNIAFATAQMLLNGSSDGDGAAGTANQCHVTTGDNQISLTNSCSISGVNQNIVGAVGQLVIDGSSNGAGFSASGSGGNGSAALTAENTQVTLTNNGAIQTVNDVYINGSVGQWVVDGSSNGACQNGAGTGGSGNAAFSASNSTFLLNNSNSISSGQPSCFIIKSAGQLIIDGTSNGAGNQGLGTGGNGHASFSIAGSTMTLNNLAAGSIAVNSENDIDGAAAQLVVNGSSNAFGSATGSGIGTLGSASFSAENSQIALSNAGTITGGGETNIVGATAQLAIDGSSNGIANVTGNSGNGNALFTLNNSSLTGSNSGSIIGVIPGFNCIIGAVGQVVIDGRSNLKDSASTPGNGSAAFTGANSIIALSNSRSISGQALRSLLGQLIIDGSSNGLGDFSGTGIGGNGNASFLMENGTITLSNEGTITAQTNDISAGQLLVDGGSLGFGDQNGTGTGGDGNAAFAIENTTLTLNNLAAGVISINPSNDIDVSAAQLLINGASQGLSTNGGSGSGGIGNASFSADQCAVVLNNAGTIMGGSAAQLVVDGSSNSGSGHASFSIDNSTLIAVNTGTISSEQGMAGQLVFDDSVLKAGDNVTISVTNKGTIATTGSTLPNQIYFHNAVIEGAPQITVANLNPAANIEGILFDENSSAGSAILSLINTSLVVNTTPSTNPFSIGGLNGNGASTVKLLTNDLQIDTAAGATTLFAGNISGSGKSLFIDGQGTQVLTGANTFTGPTIVNGGTLALNGSVQQDVFVDDGGTLTGIGSIGQDLTFASGSTYLVELSGIPFSATCLHAGGILTPGGALKLVSTNGTYSIGRPYTILTGGALNPTEFSSVLVNSPWLIATPIYDFDPSVLVQLNTNFLSGARSQNQRHVAAQVDGIPQPTGDEEVVINALLGLNGAELPDALAQMAGEQYAYLVQVNQMADRRFSGRIFEEIRAIIRPCSCRASCPCPRAWLSVEGGRFVNEGRRKLKGFHATSCDISFGAQVPLDAEFLVGAAVNFEKNWLHFNLGGKNTLHTEQLGVYALWRSDDFYLFSDLVGGSSRAHFKRPIRFDALDRVARSRPRFYHGAWYGEAGVDFRCRDWLLQPFYGLDVTYVFAKKIEEADAESLNLRIRNHKTTCPDSYLGAHLTLCNACTEVSADVIWRYRCGSLGSRLHPRFIDFGNTFGVNGYDPGRNSMIGRLRVAQEILPGLQAYGEFTGEFALRRPTASYNWSGIAGIGACW